MKAEVKAELFGKLIEKYQLFTKWIIKHVPKITEAEIVNIFLKEIDEIEAEIRAIELREETQEKLNDDFVGKNRPLISSPQYLNEKTTEFIVKTIKENPPILPNTSGKKVKDGMESELAMYPKPSLIENKEKIVGVNYFAEDLLKEEIQEMEIYAKDHYVDWHAFMDGYKIGLPFKEPFLYPLVNDKPFPCKVCGESFDTYEEYYEHYDQNHNQDRHN